MYCRHDDPSESVTLKKPRKHFRSSSCDIKITRSNSKEYDSDHRLKLNPRSHSRNNSRDNNELIRPNNEQNFKFIMNHLKSTAKETDQLNKINHTRNNSLDTQIMPKQLDHEFNKKFIKNHSRTNSKDYEINLLKKDLLDSKFFGIGGEKPVDSKFTHSRSNSKDLDATNILRHRRTSSKDLKLLEIGGAGSEHKRNSSQHKIQIEQEQETSLLRTNSQSEDNLVVNDCDSTRV